MAAGLEDRQIDLLKELGNIGMGHAASSLSLLLGEDRVEMLVPEVSVVPLKDVADNMGGPEKRVAGIYVKVRGDLILHMVFIFPVESALALVSALTAGQLTELDELGYSAVLEVGNILTSGYLNALAALLEMTLIPFPPEMAVDLTEAILGAILAKSQVAEDYIVMVKTSFTTGKSKVEGFLTIIPDEESFEAVYNKFLKGV